MGGHMNNHPAGQVPNPNYHNLPSHTYPAQVISSPSHSFLQKSLINYLLSVYLTIYHLLMLPQMVLHRILGIATELADKAEGD